MAQVLTWFLIGSALLVPGYVFLFLILGLGLGVIAPHLDWKRWPVVRRAKRGIREVARQRVPHAAAWLRTNRKRPSLRLAQPA